MLKRFLKEINQNISDEHVKYVLSFCETFWLYEDPLEPPSSGAFICAANASDLASGATAMLACCGAKHMPFEEAIRAFRRDITELKGGVGFGHPIYKDKDPRVVAFFNDYDVVGIKTLYVANYVGTPIINPAGAFAAICSDLNLDERAAIIPIISRLLGLSTLYQPSRKLISSYESLNLPIPIHRKV